VIPGPWGPYYPGRPTRRPYSQTGLATETEGWTTVCVLVGGRVARTRVRRPRGLRPTSRGCPRPPRTRPESRGSRGWARAQTHAGPGLLDRDRANHRRRPLEPGLPSAGNRATRENKAAANLASGRRDTAGRVSPSPSPSSSPSPQRRRGRSRGGNDGHLSVHPQGRHLVAGRPHSTWTGRSRGVAAPGPGGPRPTPRPHRRRRRRRRRRRGLPGSYAAPARHAQRTRTIERSHCARIRPG
jgi:hypothetical protein